MEHFYMVIAMDPDNLEAWLAHQEGTAEGTSLHIHDEDSTSAEGPEPPKEARIVPDPE